MKRIAETGEKEGEGGGGERERERRTQEGEEGRNAKNLGAPFASHYPKNLRGTIDPRLAIHSTGLTVIATIFPADADD